MIDPPTTDAAPILFLHASAIDGLRQLPDNSVHIACTSPPYYGLRAYGTDPQVWGGDPTCEHVWSVSAGYVGHRGNRGQVPQSKWKVNTTYPQHTNAPQATCTRCGAWRGELGQEPTPELFIEHLVEVFREVRRVLHPSGVLWLNLGDSYNAAGRSGHGTRIGYKQMTNRASANGSDWCRPNDESLKPKDMLGMPWRVAFALQAAGWYLRADIPWIKRNAMPSSVRDRPSSALEYVFLLSKSKDCFYDQEAVKLPAAKIDDRANKPRHFNADRAHNYNSNTYGRYDVGDGETRQRRNTDWFFESWEGLYDEGDGPLAFVVNINGYDGAHFATWPEALVRPMILASTSAKGCCPKCLEPWVRIVERDRKATRPGRNTKVKGDSTVEGNRDPERHVTSTRTVGWEPGCDCDAGEPIPSRVLDPFSGSGTTVAVAAKLGRHGIGIDLNAEYLEMARKRCNQVAGVGGLFEPAAPGPVKVGLFDEVPDGDEQSVGGTVPDAGGEGAGGS